MRFFAALAATTALVFATATRAADTQSMAAQPAVTPPLIYFTTVAWDSTYDDPAGEVDTVACSGGDNGLNPPYAQFGDLPNFPYIGGAQFVESYGSPNCGSCWALAYKGKVIYVTLIDTYYTGFNIAKEAMDELTDSNSDDGPVNVTAHQVPKALCGF